MADQENNQNSEEQRTEHERERAESRRNEAENPGTGGSGWTDDDASRNAKDAGKADAEAERAQKESDE